MSDQRAHEVNLLDLIAFVLRWRVFLITAVLSVSLVVAVIAFLLPPRYRSTAVIRGTESSSQGIGGLVASKLASMGALAGFSPMMGEVPGELLIQILKSRWMTEILIDEFDLRGVYRMKDEPIEDVIKIALSHTRYELDPESQSLFIHAEDNDAKRSCEMAEFLVDKLDLRNQELRSEKARREREFIGKRLDESKASLAMLEDSLRHFQLRTGVLDPEEQVKATIQAAAVLEAEKLSIQTQIELNALIYDNRNAGSQQYLYSKVASVDSSLQQLVRRKSADGASDFLLRLQDTPDQAIVFLRLKRDIEIQSLLVAFLIQQHEQARIEELRNTPTLMRLDQPMTATKRIWPRRGLMVTIAAFSTFVFAMLIALTIDFFKSAQHPDHPQYSHVRLLKTSWNRRI